MKEVKELGNGKIEVDGRIYEEKGSSIISKLKESGWVKEAVYSNNKIRVTLTNSDYPISIEEATNPFIRFHFDDGSRAFSPRTLRSLAEVVSIIHVHCGGIDE